jgi:hypothetical protein
VSALRSLVPAESIGSDRNEKPSRLSLSASFGRTTAATSRTTRSPTSTNVRPGRRRTYAAIRGFDLGDEIALLRMDAEPRRIARGESDHRRAGIDHEGSSAARRQPSEVGPSGNGWGRKSWRNAVQQKSASLRSLFLLLVSCWRLE